MDKKKTVNQWLEEMPAQKLKALYKKCNSPAKKDKIEVEIKEKEPDIKEKRRYKPRKDKAAIVV